MESNSTAAAPPSEVNLNKPSNIMVSDAETNRTMVMKNNNNFLSSAPTAVDATKTNA